MATVPRVQGDGMDSEALRKEEKSRSGKKRSRHKNLNRTETSTSIVKNSAINYVPHEPVRGAVRPITAVQKGTGLPWSSPGPQGGAPVSLSSQLYTSRGLSISSVPVMPPSISSSPNKVTKAILNAPLTNGSINHVNTSPNRNVNGVQHSVSLRQSGSRAHGSGESPVLQPPGTLLNSPWCKYSSESQQNLVKNVQGRTVPPSGNVLKNVDNNVKGTSQIVKEANSHRLPKRKESQRPTSATSTIEIVSKSPDGAHRQTVREIQVPVYGAPSHLKMSTYESIRKQTEKNDSVRINMVPKQIKQQIESISRERSESMNSQATCDMASKSNLGGSTNAMEERQVEGDVQTPQSDVEKLLEERDMYKKQLDMQTKVNGDLKRLLVASVGDELHSKVEDLVKDRVHLTMEVGGFTQKIHQDSEHLDKVAIQADVWRSKYLASRVLIEQLSSWKTFLDNKYREAQQALHRVLQERQTMKEELLATHRYLRQLRDAFDPVNAHKPTYGTGDVLDLTQANLKLVDGVKFRLLGSTPPLHTSMEIMGVDSLTPAEQWAVQIMTDQSVSQKDCPVPSSVKEPMMIGPIDRWHPLTRHDNITFNCCSKCRGDLCVGHWLSMAMLVFRQALDKCINDCT